MTSTQQQKLGITFLMFPERGNGIDQPLACLWPVSSLPLTGIDPLDVYEAIFYLLRLKTRSCLDYSSHSQMIKHRFSSKNNLSSSWNVQPDSETHLKLKYSSFHPAAPSRWGARYGAGNTMGFSSLAVIPEMKIRTEREPRGYTQGISGFNCMLVVWS